MDEDEYGTGQVDATNTPMGGEKLTEPRSAGAQQLASHWIL